MDHKLPLEELSDVERIKVESGGLRGPVPDELASDASHVSDEAYQVLKFHGVYQQDDRDTRRDRKKAGLEPEYSMMIRSKIPGGVLTSEQYLAHDDIAGRYANGTLRVTTRQCFQLHGVVKGNLRATIRELNEALVTTLGACGDVQRNVMSCPAPIEGGLRDEAFRIIRSISDRTLPRTKAYHEIWMNGEKVAGGEPEAEHDPLYGEHYLPRKFKTALAFPGDNCTDILTNDLGYIAIEEDGRLAGFNVTVGGGLGMTHNKPETFPRLADPLGYVPADEIEEVTDAVLAVQRDHGNRRNRRRARMKYLIDERGIEWFRSEVEGRLGRELEPSRDVTVEEIHDHLGWHAQGDGKWFYGLFIENGRIRDGEGLNLRSGIRELVETFRPGIHLTPHQNLLFTDIAEADRPAFEGRLDELGFGPKRKLSTVRRWAMACPALPTCGLALTESERALPGVLSEFETELERLGLERERFTVRMTGCPNGCARPYNADVGFVGRGGTRYKVFVGGTVVGDRLAYELADRVSVEELTATIVPLLERYRDDRKGDESFGDFCARLGPEAAKALVEESKTLMAGDTV